MRKRILVSRVFVIIFLALGLSACQNQTENVILSEDGIKDNSDKDELSFSDLSDLEFWFGTGVGAKETRIKIRPDGSFTGYYYDANMGENSDAYPNGTRYECFFTGIFSSLKKVDDFEYSMICESLVEEGTVGEEEIVDGVRVVTVGAYGFDQANEFLIYLPEKKVYGLPENFLVWVGIVPDSLHPETDNPEIEDRLTFYGLYNVSGETGFRAIFK